MKKSNKHNEIIYYINNGSDNLLVLFPFLGGFAYSYNKLMPKLKGKNIDIITINPPGHFINNDKPLENIEEMADLYLKELEPFLKKNTILFGHSMGGIVAYKIAHRLSKMDVKAKTRLLISAANPPDFYRELNRISEYNDAMLIEYIREYMHLDKELIQEEEFMSFILPFFRSDFKALENLVSDHTNKLNFDAEVYYATDDKIVNVQHVEKWQHYFANPIRFKKFDGDHMYLFDNTNKFVNEVMSLF